MLRICIHSTFQELISWMNLSQSAGLPLSFLLLALLGNLRTWIGLSIVDQSFTPVIERIEKKSENDELISLFIPKEFPAVTFTTNQIIHNHLEESKPFLLGKSYLNLFAATFNFLAFSKSG